MGEAKNFVLFDINYLYLLDPSYQLGQIIGQLRNYYLVLV